jgi:hypothetical protein
MLPAKTNKQIGDMISIEHYVVAIATDMCDGQVEDDQKVDLRRPISRFKTTKKSI